MVTETQFQPGYDVESAVRQRYEAGAKQFEAALCCAVNSYDPSYLDVLPPEIRETDYGCGDPTRYVKPGDTVVDLGSGSGKHCYIMAQKVGATGHVIGVDFNDEMLGLARKHQEAIATQLGYNNVSFVKAKIQDLRLNLEVLDTWLSTHPVNDLDQYMALDSECIRLRQEETAIPDNTVDVVVSNCVLNLVRPQDKLQLFQEIFRVLNRGGRAVISDIVCDDDLPDSIINDPELWSGCIAGAFREDRFLQMFEQAGFYGMEILDRQETPWQVIDGIEFRSVTVQAFKGKQGDCWERNQAVIYKGPWKSVQDDDGHTLYRGQRMAVCDKTFNIYTSADSPYRNDVIAVPPYVDIPLDAAIPFSCKQDQIRAPRDTKNGEGVPQPQSSGGGCCG